MIYKWIKTVPILFIIKILCYFFNKCLNFNDLGKFSVVDISENEKFPQIVEI